MGGEVVCSWCFAVGELDSGAQSDNGDKGSGCSVLFSGSRVLRHPHEVSDPAFPRCSYLPVVDARSGCRFVLLSTVYRGLEMFEAIAAFESTGDVGYIVSIEFVALEGTSSGSISELIFSCKVV